MSGAQDVVSLLRILDFDEDMLVLLDRNFKEIERLLGPLQVYEKLIGKQVNTSVQAAGITLDGVIPTASLSDKMVGLAHELQIASAAVVNAKMAVDAVKAMNIENGAVVADKIAANAVTANKIEAGAVTALKINVENLAAISANIGDITAGTITGITITGGTVRTAATGARVELYNNRLNSYNASGQKHGAEIDPTGGYSAALVLWASGWNYGSLNNLGNGMEVWGSQDLYLITGSTSHISMGSGGVQFNSPVSGLRTAYGGPGATSLETVAAHNHGIANGTVLRKADGGDVTWVAYAGDNHGHNISNHRHSVEQGSA